MQGVTEKEQIDLFLGCDAIQIDNGEGCADLKASLLKHPSPGFHKTIIFSEQQNDSGDLHRLNSDTGQASERLPECSTYLLGDKVSVLYPTY